MRTGLSGTGAVTLLGLLAFGCRGDGGGGGAGVPFDQLGAKYAEVFCHKLFTCCDATELASGTATMVDEATCRTMIAAQIDADAANVEAGIASGRTRYHGERAQRCLDTLTALACDRWGGDDELHAFPDCLTIFEGTVAPGGACDRSEQCNGGHCASSACVADPKLGEQCDIGACVPELVCLYAPIGSTDPAICGHPRPDGAQCSYSDECESHSCARNAAGVTVCTPPTICNGV